jgi:hypothetical protein
MISFGVTNSVTVHTSGTVAMMGHGSFRDKLQQMWNSQMVWFTTISNGPEENEVLNDALQQRSLLKLNPYREEYYLLPVKKTIKNMRTKVSLS